MYKIVLFLERSDDAWSTPLKIGSLLFNMMVIEEDACIEVIGTYYLEHSFSKMSFPQHDEYDNFTQQRQEKEKLDIDIFRCSFKDAKTKYDKLKPFFIYAGNYYRWNRRLASLKVIFRLGSSAVIDQSQTTELVITYDS